MSTSQLKQAVTGKVENPFDKLRLQLTQRRADLAQLLGQHVDRFIQVTLNSVIHRPELIDADRQSFFFACRQAAQDGLYPDGKEAVLNIYNTKVKTDEGERWIRKVQYLPMVRGLVKLIWMTGQFSMVDAVAVYQRDFFEYRRGDDPRIEHLPYGGDDDPGPIVAAYFIGKLKSGEIKREVMFARDIAKARSASKTPDKGPWVEWPDQMAIKSVIHRAWKQLPSVPEIDSVIERGIQATISGGLADDVLGVQQGAAQSRLPEHAGGEPANTFTVDRDTGEIKTAENIPTAPTEQPAAASAAPSATKARPKAARDPDAAASVYVPFSIIDALAAVGDGRHEDARDMGRSLGPDALARVEKEIVARG